MKKTVWLILSTFSALSAGYFLYDGQDLLFTYHDRRQGVLLLAAGCFIVLFYAYCICHAFPGRRASERLTGPPSALSTVLCGVFPGFAAAGFAVWYHRYEALWYITASAGAAFLLTAFLLFVLRLLYQRHRFAKENPASS